MISINIKIIEELKEFLYKVKDDDKWRILFTNSEKAFTKNRKLPLEKLVLLIINILKKSLSVELHEFFDIIGQGKLVCSKAAFCLQRVKLKYDFFCWWNVQLVNSFYHYHKENLKRWRGYRIVAVDGSTEYLINKPEVIDYFGVQSNQSVSVAMGRILSYFDVLNDITISAHLLPVRFSEQEIVNSCISCYEADMLFLYDRGFPSFTTIYLHLNQEQELKFIMRSRNNFNSEVIAFNQSRSKSKIVEFKANDNAVKELEKHGYKITIGTKIKVRLVKVFLDNGTIEILITNLYNEQEYPVKIFKNLYFKRWGIETNYNTQKNTLQLESFSGQKVITILQDFYASIFIGNLQSIISKQCETKIDATNSHRKYRYKVNKNVSIGMMKNRIIFLFMSRNPEQILQELENLFARSLEPIRPNRKYKRVIKCKRANGKYQTLTNYKRAI